MTSFAPQLVSLRLMLEQARLTLRGRNDYEASELTEKLNETIGRIVLIESGAMTDPHGAGAAYVTRVGNAMLGHVRAYCEERRIHYRCSDTPSPRSGTVVLTHEEIQAAMRGSK